MEDLKELLLSLADRIDALEHKVDVVLIGGLKKAADEYKYDEDFGAFDVTYGPSIESLIEPYKLICGPDYDLKKEMFDALRNVEGYGTEGFDEAGVVNAKIAELQERINKLKDIKDEKEETVEDDVASDNDEIPSEEQLMKELKEYN